MTMQWPSQQAKYVQSMTGHLSLTNMEARTEEEG